MKILFSGGGTLGSVSPLLAVVAPLRQAGHELFFVGTHQGPEQKLVEEAGLPFAAISAPKLRRYLSWRHLLVPFELARGLWQARQLLRRWQPDLIVSAGGFVSVPVVWAGHWRKIPAVVHQQDLEPGLANRIMARWASRITVAFEYSKKDFATRGAAVVWTGNPVRPLTPTTQAFALDPAFPTVLITGGGTGAQGINALVTAQLCASANVIHLTGKGRAVNDFTHERYFRHEFLGAEMAEAIARADLVVSRAGLGTISELAALGKPSLIIPMPDSHQAANAEFLKKREAAVVLDQTRLTAESFRSSIEDLLADGARRRKLGQAIHALAKPDATEQFLQVLYDTAAGK